MEDRLILRSVERQRAANFKQGRFVCEYGVCTKSYVHRRDLTKHQHDKHWDGPRSTQSQTCDLCGAEFRGTGATRWHLQRHIKDHCKFNPGVCNRSCLRDYCYFEWTKVALYTPYLLNSLCLTEVVDTVVVCRCGKKFKTQSGYARHYKSVHEQNKVVCDVCNEVFSSRDSLREHRKLHGGDPAGEFRCPGCARQFRSRSGLAYHRKVGCGGVQGNKHG